MSLLMVALVYVGLAALAYSTSLRGVFVFDDIPAIVENRNLRSLMPLSAAVDAPAGSTLSGRPVATFTFALNYAMTAPDVRDVMGPDAAPPGEARERFDRNVRGYHVFNVGLHVLAALALFGVVRRTLVSAPLRSSFGPAATLLAASIGAIWLVHPLQTASVTYIVQRVEVLMGLFYLVALYCAIRADQEDHGPWRWIVAAIAACALGMGSKEVMVTAPVLIATWLAVFGDRGEDAPFLSRPRLVMLAGLASTWLLLATLIVSSTEARAILSGLSLDTGVEATAPAWSFSSYLLTQTQVVLHYIRLSLAAAPQTIDYYGWPPATLRGAAPHLTVVGALAAGTILLLGRRRPGGFAGAWFFGILAPTSSFIPIGTEVAAEHRMYLPLAAIVALTVLGSYALLTRPAKSPSQAAPDRRRPTLAVMAFVAVVVAFLITATQARNRDYWSEEVLWHDSVQKRPDNARARVNYGITLMRSQQYHEAEAQMIMALEQDMDRETRAQAHLQLGAARCAMGRCQDGLAHVEQALALDPASPEVYAILGEACFQVGDLTRARQYYLEAAARKPRDVRVLNRVAWFLATAPDPALRDGATAVELATRAVALAGRQDPVAWDSLAAGHAASGNFVEATVAGREALSLARNQGRLALAAELAERLAFYESRRPVK